MMGGDSVNGVRRTFESRIRHGKFNLESVLHLLDMYHIDGKLTDADREELRTMARENAASQDEQTSLLERIEAIEQRLTALEEREGVKRGENR